MTSIGLCTKYVISYQEDKMKKLNLIAAAVLGSCLGTSAFAQLEGNVGACTFGASGQAKVETGHRTGGVLPDTNQDFTNTVGFIDLRLDAKCKASDSTTLEMRLRQRPLKGSNFDIQGHTLGAREAWLGVANSSAGTFRVGRFLTKMNSVLDWPYGAPALNAQAGDYGATPSAPTRKISLRYIAPTFYGIDLETTIGTASDIELYGQYKIAGFSIDAIHSRAKMNSAYRFAAGSSYSFDDGRDLTNQATFLGARYEFGNQAKILAGFKNNVFSYPVTGSGRFNASGTFRQETSFNEIVVSGEYPIADKWKIGAGVVRYLDSKTRGVTANDGATLFGAVVSYTIIPNLDALVLWRQVTLDRVGAIPGSSSGVNEAIPSTTRRSLGLENRQWVFEQGGGLGSKRVNYIGAAIQYAF
jgi:predicted porin